MSSFHHNIEGMSNKRIFSSNHQPPQHCLYFSSLKLLLIDCYFPALVLCYFLSGCAFHPCCLINRCSLPKNQLDYLPMGSSLPLFCSSVKNEQLIHLGFQSILIMWALMLHYNYLFTCLAFKINVRLSRSRTILWNLFWYIPEGIVQWVAGSNCLLSGLQMN